MTKSLQPVHDSTPESRELNAKIAELAALRSQLAQRELDLATLQAELTAFEHRYLHTVGARYAKLDEIEAQIAETIASARPDSDDAQRQFAEARSRAEESSRAIGDADERSELDDFTPTADLKKLYRSVARRVHPDLAASEEERLQRHRLMVEANLAYARGDEARLRAILNDWESSPESVKGDGPGAELVRAIRKIDQVRRRLDVIALEISSLTRSDLYQLRNEVLEADRKGRDLLGEMAEQVDRDIEAAAQRLAATPSGDHGS